MEPKETLPEDKKEAQSHAKRQTGTGRVIANGGAGGAAARIRLTRKEDVDQAAQLRGKRGICTSTRCFGLII